MTTRVLIRGTGLIGTSLGIALTRSGYAVSLTDPSPTAERLARDLGAGELAHLGDDSGPQPDLVIVAAPPDVAADVVTDSLRRWPDSVVTDVASVKGAVLEAARAADADPSFVPTWVGPLLWGCSAEQLCAGPFDIQGAQRRDDGTYSPTTRTRARPGTWAGFDLNRLVDRINAAADGPSRVVFGAPNQPVRLIRPRTSFGLGAIELDEVNQRFIWPVVDHLGYTHRLTLGASEKSAQVLAWLTGRIKLCALVVVGDELQAAFHLDSGQLALVSLTLSPVPLQKVAASWRRFFTRLDKERRATAPARELDDLQRLCAGVGDLALALAAGGVRALSEREHDALGRRRREASDLALGTLVAALEPLASGQAGAAEVLTLRFLLDRLEALLA